MVIRIQPDSSILLIHKTGPVEAITHALKGKVDTKRASHVEPVPHPEGGPLPNWNVDLSPVNGPACLSQTYQTREEALHAEADWIENNFLKGKQEIIRTKNQ